MELLAPYVLIFLFLHVCFSEKDVIDTTVKVGKAKFTCTFTLISNEDLVDKKLSKLTCSPKKPKKKKVLGFELSGNLGKYVVSFSINPSKILKATLEPAVGSTGTGSGSAPAGTCPPGYSNVCPPDTNDSCSLAMSLSCPTTTSPTQVPAFTSCTCLPTSGVEQDLARGVSPLGSCYSGCACLPSRLLTGQCSDAVALLTGGRIGSTRYTESEVIGVTGCSIPPLTAGRIAHMTVLTYDGTFLTCGGSSVFPKDCQSWVPGGTSGSDWAPHSTLISERVYSSAVVLPSGTYVIGGSSTNIENEMLPTGSNTWQDFSATPITNQNSYRGCAVDIGTTRFLSNDQDNVQEYDTDLETWTVWPGLTQNRVVHSCARLGNKVVVAGGYDNGYLTSTEIIDIIDKTVIAGGNLHDARGYFGMAAVSWPPGSGEQRIIAFGGLMYNPRVDYDSIEVWTGSEWEQSNITLTTPKSSFGYTAIPAQFCA